MTNWLDKVLSKAKEAKAKLSNAFQKRSLDAPKDFWHNCKSCTNILTKENLEKNFYCCTKCSRPAFLAPRDRFKIFFDNGEYTELNHKVTTNHDPLKWEDLNKYKDKVIKAKKTFNQDSAVLCAEGLLNGTKVQVVAFNSQYLGGSFGIPESQVFLKAVDHSIKNNLPFICFSAGGGMRVTSGALALMGMPKVVIGFDELRRAKVPSINIFCDPTAGGLTCIFYMADFSFAEDETTRIIFSGRKTIESVIGEKLDDTFGTAKHCIEKGFLDDIIPRSQQRDRLSSLISIMLNKNINQSSNEQNIYTEDQAVNQ